MENVILKEANVNTIILAGFDTIIHSVKVRLRDRSNSATINLGNEEALRCEGEPI